MRLHTIVVVLDGSEMLQHPAEHLPNTRRVRREEHARKQNLGLDDGAFVGKGPNAPFTVVAANTGVVHPAERQVVMQKMRGDMVDAGSTGTGARDQ
ncbi:hypothetical protein FQZ97_1142380 [compost metagenome]